MNVSIIIIKMHLNIIVQINVILQVLNFFIVVKKIVNHHVQVLINIIMIQQLTNALILVKIFQVKNLQKKNLVIQEYINAYQHVLHIMIMIRIYA